MNSLQRVELKLNTIDKDTNDLTYMNLIQSACKDKDYHKIIDTLDKIDVSTSEFICYTGINKGLITTEDKGNIIDEHFGVRE